MNDVARTADYGFDYVNAIRTTDGSQVANHLLRELMEAMGVSLFARGETPRAVWLEMLDKVRAAEAELAQARELLRTLLEALHRPPYATYSEEVGHVTQLEAAEFAARAFLGES